MNTTIAGEMLAILNDDTQPTVEAVVLQCCLNHPEWGTQEGARRSWSRASSGQGDYADVTIAEALWDAGYCASHVYDMDWYGNGSCVVHGAVLVGDLAVDVTGRRFDARLPFPLILPKGEWWELFDAKAVA